MFVARLVARLVRATLALLGRLPLPLLHALGRQIGNGQWRLKVRAANTTRRNIAACFPCLTPAEQEALARASLRETGCLAMEAGLVWGLPAERVLQHVTAQHGVARLDDALAQQRGVIICAPHLGNWELMNRYLGSRVAMTAMYEPPESKWLDQLLREVRGRDQSILVPTNARGIRSMVASLRDGGVVGMLPDQVPPRDAGGVYAPFFGRPALTGTLIHRLAGRRGRHGLPVVLLSFATRCADSAGFALHFEEVTGLEHSDPVQAASRLNEAIAGAVTRFPAQYQWEYKRFKHPPDDGPDPYK